MDYDIFLRQCTIIENDPEHEFPIQVSHPEVPNSARGVTTGIAVDILYKMYKEMVYRKGLVQPYCYCKLCMSIEMKNKYLKVKDDFGP